MRSTIFPEKIYIGRTNNIKKRFTDHNSGTSRHTKKFRPWIIEVCIAFSSESKSIEFEKYLKSGSGRVFRNKRFL